MVYWWVWLIIQAAIFVAAELLRPKPKFENQKPAGLGDFRFPTATGSRVVPLIWGTVKQSGPNVTWYGDFRQVPITVKQKTGLFTSFKQIVGFKYFLGIQLVLCRMAVDSLRRVWIGDVEVFNGTGIFGVGVGAGGTNYSVHDVLTLLGGAGTAARVRVEQMIGQAVSKVSLIDAGVYTSFPSSPASTTGGTGTGCTITFSSSSIITHGQDLVIDCPELFGGQDLGSGGVQGTLTFFAGTDTQAASPYLASHSITGNAVVAVGGSSYAVGDILEVSGGTFTAKAKVQVLTLSGSAVATVQVIDPGFYTAFPSNPASTTNTTGVGSGCTLTLTQAAGFQGIGGVTPRYLRTCYLVPKQDPIYLGNSTSIAPWSFELRRIPDGLGLGAEATVNGADANPMNVLYELLTNREWGLRQAVSAIDVANLSTAGDILHSEGNGFSMILDRRIEAADFLHLIEEQVDGVVFFNQLVGKWQINLARGGYDVDTLPLLSVSNIVELESFSRAAWEDTTNQILVKFQDRADGYKDSSALAQDQANIDVLQGAVVSAEVEMPGVKNAALANSLAWRALRGLSYPLAKAVLIVDRTMYGVQPGQPLAWTYDVGGEAFVKMAVRVGEIDYGELADGKIRLSVVQDVFSAAAGVYTDPGDTLWGPPSQALVPFVYQQASEAPRAIVRRDPLTDGEVLDKVWAAARRAGPEVGFSIRERHAAGSPSGAFADVGQVYGMMLVGRLQSALARGSAVPLTSLVIVPGPDTQSALESAFADAADAADVGRNLLNLILVRSASGDEYMLATSAQTSGGNVQLNGVYRGVMDSVQGSHLAGALVYVLQTGAGLSDSTVPATDNVEVKLVPFSRSAELTEAAATAIAFAMANRVRRPYPPSRISLDGTAWKTTTTLEDNGSGPETFAIDVSDVRRRDYRTDDEAQALTADASTIFADFPTANTTVHKIDVRNDPAGANTLLFTTATFSVQNKDVRRIEILKATDGVLPTTLRFDTFARHTHESVAYDSRDPLRHDFAVTTALTGQFNFGARLASVSSNVYTTVVSGTFTLTLSSAFTTGAVQASINAGAFVTIIAAGLTTGMIVIATAGDTITLRHTSTDSAALKQVSLDNPSAVQVGYFIAHTP